MGNDNSSSQLKVKDQVAEVNRILKEVSKNFQENEEITEAIKVLKSKQQKYQQMQRVFETYLIGMIGFENNSVTTKKTIGFPIREIFDLSKNSMYSQQLKKGMATNEEIAKNIQIQMKKYVDELIQELNEYVSFTFYMISYEEVKCKGLAKDGSIDITSVFRVVIDIE